MGAFLPVIPVLGPILEGIGGLFGGLFGGGGGPGPGLLTATRATQAQIASATTATAVAAAASAALGQTITDNISSLVDQTSSILKGVTSAIADALKTVAQTIFDGVKAALSKIGDILKDIASKLGDLLTKLFHDIYAELVRFLQAIQDTIIPLIEKVANVVDAIAKQVQAINDKLIKPIADAVKAIQDTIIPLTQAIEKDLHEGLSGILRIPTDIANGLGSLDATLQRTVEQLGKVNQPAVTAGIHDGTVETVQKPLNAINDTFTLPAGAAPVTTTFKDHVRLTEPGGLEKITASVQRLVNNLGISESTGLLSAPQSFKELIDSWKDHPHIFQWILSLVIDIAMSLTEIGATAEPLLEYAREVAKKLIPVSKLPPTDVLEAWRRGLVDDGDLSEELLRQGFNDSRQKVLRDLQIFLAPIDLTLQWARRGFITGQDLRDNLKEHGLDDAQITATLENDKRVFPVDLGVTLWRRSLIDTNTLSTIMQRNQFSDAEIDAIFQTFESKPDPVQQLSGDLFRIMFGELSFNRTIEAAPSAQLQTAAKRAGWSAEQLQQFWWGHWNIPPVIEWINLYFRGFRTKTEVFAVMDAFSIPKESQDDLIEAARPLVPFRSIPGMLRAGAINEATARRALEAHGFSEPTVLQLLAFANSKLTPATSQKATQLHSVSMSVADTLFQDGAITEEQYAQILGEHGLDPNAVQMTVKAEMLKIMAAERRATAQGIVDEASVGLITPEAAQQQLAQSNFTQPEIAKYVKSIRSAKVKTAKLPGEAELNHMMQKSIISQDEYVAALQQSGYTPDWAQRFLSLRVAAK